MISDIAILSFCAVLILLPALFSHYSRRVARVGAYISILLLVSYAIAQPFIFPTVAIVQPVLIIALVAGMINAFRVAVGINPRSYVSHQSSKTSVYAVLTLLIGGLTALLYEYGYGVADETLEITYGFITFALSLVLLLMVVKALRKKPQMLHDTESEQPSVTVAVPARNEDAILESNLHQLLESTYPKLEIIVIDDCSHDSTAQIIKSFAHRGIRFIGGEEVSDDWLGKNYAYQQLLEHASGEIVLFLGADVKLTPEAIGELVSRMKKNNLKMLSVMPEYQPVATKNSLWEVAQQVTRYFWQIGMIRMISTAPPVVGSCMMLDRELLEEYGGFKALRHMVEPERFFASKLSETSEYQFITSRDLISDVVSTKSGEGQMLRTIRVAYPLLHRSIVRTLISILAVILFLLVPVSALLLSPFMLPIDSPVFGFLIGSGLAAYISFILVFMYVSPGYVWVSILMLPITTLNYLVLMAWSMLKYEFLGVQWKGRNVCIPVLDLRFKPAPKKKRGRRPRRSRRRRRNQERRP